jgi:hypothetical protein
VSDASASRPALEENPTRPGSKVVATIEPDATYPNMWRVRRPDGSLSDMVNIIRARDAAETMSLTNYKGRETTLAASPVSYFEHILRRP